MDEVTKLRDELLAKFDEKFNEKASNFLTANEIKKIQSDFETAVKNMNKKTLTEYAGTIEKLNTDIVDISEIAKELKEICVKQGEEITAIKGTQIATQKAGLTKNQRVEKLVSAFVRSELMQKYEHAKFHGESERLNETDVDKVVDITSDYTGGTIVITERSGNIIDTPNRVTNVRDIISTTTTDQPNIVGQEVYSWSDALTGSADVLAENGAAGEASFKIKENTWGIKRIAAFTDLSKRMLKSNGTRWISNHLANVLPMKLKFKEDFELLYGDGSGDHVTGLSINAQAVAFGGNTYIATSFASHATWNSGTQTLITFAAAHSLHNGDTLTLANTTGTTYDGAHANIKVASATQIVIDQAYTADINVAANWTGTSANPFADSIDNAQEYDVLIATMGNVMYQNRKINGFIMNPVDVAKIELLKGTDAHYVGIGRDGSGILRVNGLPVVETTAVAAGEFFAGVFDADVVELAEFTQLSLYMTTDVTYAKANKVAIIIEEEIIFPIFEPLAIFYGNFATAIAALETP